MPIRTLDHQSHLALDGELHKLLNLIVEGEPHGTCESSVESILTSEHANKLLYPGWEMTWDCKQQIAWARFANDSGKRDHEGDAMYCAIIEMARYVRSAASAFDKQECQGQLRVALLRYLSRRGVHVPLNDPGVPTHSISREPRQGLRGIAWSVHELVGSDKKRLDHVRDMVRRGSREFREFFERNPRMEGEEDERRWKDDDAERFGTGALQLGPIDTQAKKWTVLAAVHDHFLQDIRLDCIEPVEGINPWRNQDDSDDDEDLKAAFTYQAILKDQVPGLRERNEEKLREWLADVSASGDTGHSEDPANNTVIVREPITNGTTSVDDDVAAGTVKAAETGSDSPRSIKRPPEKALIAWRLRDLTGIRDQTEIANEMIRQGHSADQGQVSR